MSERWWRAKNSSVNNRKLQQLPGELFKAWYNINCLASANDGVLPCIADIAFALRLSEQRAASIVTQLVVAKLLDRKGDSIVPHDWDEHQFKSDVTDPTAAQRMKRYRSNKRNDRNAAVTVIRPDTEQIQKDSEPIGSGADTPPDPSDPERQLFVRGRELFGKKAGGQIAKMLKACGGNVSLARSKLELAATKNEPAGFVAGIIRAGPVFTAKPLTAHQRERETGREILDDLEKFVVGSSRQADFGLLRHDPGDGPEGVHGGVRGNVIAVSAIRVGKSGEPV